MTEPNPEHRGLVDTSLDDLEAETFVAIFFFNHVEM